MATNEAGKDLFEISVSPNPSTGASILTVYSEKEQSATLRLFSISGVIFFVEKQIHPGENRITLTDLGQIPAGFYFLEIEAGRQRKVVHWVKI